MRILKFLLITLGLTISLAHADVNKHLESIKNDKKALYNFFKAMPKGGELHYHLAGGASSKAMLNLAKAHHFCLDSKSNTAYKNSDKCDDISLSSINQNSSIYQKIMRAWTLKNFKKGTETKHDHFFKSFYKFGNLVNDFNPQLIASVLRKAARQNELYLEIMVLPDRGNSITFAPLIAKVNTFSAKKDILLANHSFKKNIHYTANEAKRFIVDAYEELGCQFYNAKPACKVTVKLQYIILREQSLDSLFTQALTAFAATNNSSDLVAVNLVQAEDGPIALRDYEKQMQIISYLRKQYPKVRVSLHAGELSNHKLSNTPLNPNELTYHIHDAVFKGNADRIGHGTDIMNEKNLQKLTQYMREKPVPVEVNLVSNEALLSVSKNEHPLNYYLKNNVPVVLSTDDEDILQTDLTEQYVNAVIQHNLDYKSLKQINRNALTYSFLPGKSIWANPQDGLIVDSCKTLDSKSCLQFINNSEKALIQWQLEKKLLVFENNY